MKTARPSRASRVRGAPLAIFVATQAELRPIATALQPPSRSIYRSNSMIRVGIEGRDLLLANTGVGPDNAEAAARHLFEEMPVTAALSLGVAGGLSPQLQTGDLIVGDRAILRRGSGQVLHGEKGSGSQSFPCDSGLQEAAITVIRRSGSRYYLGPILTVDRIVRTAEEKCLLAAESGAVALDMESAAIASAALAYSVPFLAIRGVLDPVHEDLAIDFDQFLGIEGEPNLPRLMRYLIAHPFTLPRLIGLGIRTKAVCARLGRLLHELSTTLS
ncbi:hypothetical protein CLG94_05610 [Candidatus Methylomirabilis limnetica]|uniref:Nucleoside phosphorylase domain-containing protein n=1 Tax=Candidatus Methylomirabilis limnetica TaxID=2033718 RepID=A0A2T4TYG4_9BACT|nr:hypothetical protein [Candidatus Methylomirabilis limnetica]PTL36139.1 hypothetical protein CLG94_05610 [Candidatus Methylomirabilis limnetica]